MPFWSVKFSVSPAKKPELIDTVALAWFVLSLSVSVRPASSTTAAPCSVKLTVAPATTTGAPTFTVLVAAALSRAPSLTVQLIVRVDSEPPLVGSALVEE